MLQRLELVGFKSFAEKTVFDFSPGITAVVGPNGSGKSNIVDAIRWVLGEQSVKSLRGQEMADVIFNGSATRRSLGLAEVTMTFDNSRQTLLTQAGTVQITRRVYRDGQGEYLINQELSRLKDIKDLFLGSGTGSDAYCIIEQGRVEVLLQSSNKDRRAIFEEAAGISRFKSKKIETLRKLERINQNLERLKDILDELDKQLRGVQLQAAKAQRYQEYQVRLKELRLGLGLREYHDLTQRVDGENTTLESLRGLLSKQAAEAEAQENLLRQFEEDLARLEESGRHQETLLTQARQQIASEETSLDHERELSVDLQGELTQTRQHLSELDARLAALQTDLTQAESELALAEVNFLGQSAAVIGLDEALASYMRGLKELQSQVQNDKTAHFEQLRQAARFHNDAITCKAHRDNLIRERDRLRQRTEQVIGHLASLDLELQDLIAAEETQQASLASVRQRLADQRAEEDRVRQSLDATSALLGDLRARRSGQLTRIEVLEGLESSLEGLGAGAREVMALLVQADSSADGKPNLSQAVVGMVADLLTVSTEHGRLIDLAMGETSQAFLVRDPDLLEAFLGRQSQPFSGRVSFLPQRSTGEGKPAESHLVGGSLEGVVALASSLVQSDKPGLEKVGAQLLGQTWIVTDLAAARRLMGRSPGCRCITLQGELVEIDGSLTVGRHHPETSILSRKIELRELREQVPALDRQIFHTEEAIAVGKQQIVALEKQAERSQQEVDVLSEQAGDLRSRVHQHRQRRDNLHEEAAVGRNELGVVEREIGKSDKDWQEAQAKAEAAERMTGDLEKRLESAESTIRDQEASRQQVQQEITTAKVRLAQVEERRTALVKRHRQVAGDLDQRRQERILSEQHRVATVERIQGCEMAMLAASSVLATCYLEKEAAERQGAVLLKQREATLKERQALREQTQARRQEWQAGRDRLHSLELKVSDLNHRRSTLVDRLREDYQIELVDVYQSLAADHTGPSESSLETAGEAPFSHGEPEILQVEEDTSQAQEEIEELRRKLARLGSVNLEALQELAELETRAGSLKTQYDDLVSSRKSLEEIIGKINDDSRKLFVDSFAAIRVHFQELFRKLFGGGMADIALEDENDVLESGIDIIARPPGKEMRSLSLMSGGEKTLTAVALLLAIFRSKPSPFCILDEVDAPLDEANVGRFTAVLREFLEQSQFILITHSKETMASADVLYGITMQESGVSKRVAVRFEDWPNDAPAEQRAAG